MYRGGRRGHPADTSRYHGDDTELEDLIHPEDIEHFKKHEEMEREEERAAELKKRSVITENIPKMFRRARK